MIADHGCAAYCRDGEHCELVYVTPGLNRDWLWREYAATYRVWVTDALPAREAPAVDSPLAPGTKMVMLAGIQPGTEPWLVWWRADYAQARADYEAGRIPPWRSEVA